MRNNLKNDFGPKQMTDNLLKISFAEENKTLQLLLLTGLANSGLSTLRKLTRNLRYRPGIDQ
ncbi:hypothetical protein PR048_013165, partial [Dryococelus australis]